MAISVKKISTRVRDLIVNPKSFWNAQELAGENRRELLTGFYYPLLILVAFAVFIGEFFSSPHFYVGYAMAKFVREILLYTLIYFASYFFSLELIKPFGGKKNAAVVQKLVVYSLTPFLLVSLISGLFPFLYVLDVLGLYGFYIFWVGVQENLKFPERKESSYILVAIAGNFILYSFISIFLYKLLYTYI